MSIVPGPGDEAMWGSPRGHTNDPRSEGEDCPDCGDEMVGSAMCHGCGWMPIEPDYEDYGDDSSHGSTMR